MKGLARFASGTAILVLVLATIHTAAPGWVEALTAMGGLWLVADVAARPHNVTATVHMRQRAGQAVLSVFSALGVLGITAVLLLTAAHDRT